MTKLFATAAVVVLAASAAHAQFFWNGNKNGVQPSIVLKIVCTPDTPDDDPNPVINTYITEVVDTNDLPHLAVTHQLADGTFRDRSKQYEFTSVAFKPLGNIEGDTRYQILWNGRLRSDARTRIVGVLEHTPPYSVTYTETWFTLRKGLRVPLPNDMHGYAATESVRSHCKVIEKWTPQRGTERDL